MKLTCAIRCTILVPAVLLVLAGCSTKPEVGAEAPNQTSGTSTSPQSGSMPPEMSKEAARVSAEASAQAAARGAAASQQPK